MSMMDIGAVILMVMMIVLLAPRVISALQESRKGTSQEWMNVALLIGGVMLFIWILMKMV